MIWHISIEQQIKGGKDGKGNKYQSRVDSGI